MLWHYVASLHYIVYLPRILQVDTLAGTSINNEWLNKINNYKIDVYVRYMYYVHMHECLYGDQTLKSKGVVEIAIQ